MTGEVEGYIYLGQQTPAYYAKQVIASLDRVRYGPAAAVFRRADGVRRRGQHRLRLSGPPGRPVLPKIARRPALLQALRRKHLPQRSLQRRRGPRRSADPRRGRRPGAAPRRAGVRRRQDLFRAERHEHVQQGGHQRGAAAAAISFCSTATTTSPCIRARWCRPARSRSSSRPRAIRSA